MAQQHGYVLTNQWNARGWYGEFHRRDVAPPAYADASRPDPATVERALRRDAELKRSIALTGLTWTICLITGCVLVGIAPMGTVVAVVLWAVAVPVLALWAKYRRAQRREMWPILARAGQVRRM